MKVRFTPRNVVVACLTCGAAGGWWGETDLTKSLFPGPWVDCPACRERRRPYGTEVPDPVDFGTVPYGTEVPDPVDFGTVEGGQ